MAGGISFRRGPMVDMPLLLAVVAILTLGLVNLYSATSVYIDDESRARLADIYVTQIYWIVVGALLAILVAAIDYRHYERLAPVLYAGGMVSLGLVFILGRDIRGSSRWIQLGSFAFQPSEFMKIFLILMVAKYVHNDSRTEPRSLVDLTPIAALIVLPVVAVMAQPDLGTSLIYLLTALSMVAMMRIRAFSVLS
ncbi:MAG TPA: FtsW/RodA/SpoVE family cell cycle protein, partial [Polyangiaceae bacterium]